MTAMADSWQRMKQRKLVLWALAHVAGAFALLQGVDIAARQFGWADGLQRGITLALALGFLVTLVLARYHGERGAQAMGGAVLVPALLLAIGGGLLWGFTDISPGPERAVAPATAATAPTPADPVPTLADIPARSIAVLPLNLSAEKANEDFVAGMQDLILTGLAGSGEMKVISRTSTGQYASHPDTLKQIAQDLGVAHGPTLPDTAGATGRYRAGGAIHATGVKT